MISHAQLKLFLYGNIVSLNSTINGTTYGLHGRKKSKSDKRVFCTTDDFCQSFLSSNLYFYGFLEKKKYGEKSLPYLAPYMLRRMICMVKIFDILSTACITKRNRLITILLR